jgi:hypothetical protein
MTPTAARFRNPPHAVPTGVIQLMVKKSLVMDREATEKPRVE